MGKVFTALVLRFAFLIAVRNVRECAIRSWKSLLREEEVKVEGLEGLGFVYCLASLISIQ
jgi:hypothetical protein